MASGPPVSVKPNSCGSPDGSVTLSIRMLPPLVFSNVQVTVSPGSTVMLARLVSSLSQLALVIPTGWKGSGLLRLVAAARLDGGLLGVAASVRLMFLFTVEPAGPPVRVNGKLSLEPLGFRLLVDDDLAVLGVVEGAGYGLAADRR